MPAQDKPRSRHMCSSSAGEGVVLDTVTKRPSLPSVFESSWTPTSRTRARVVDVEGARAREGRRRGTSFVVDRRATSRHVSCSIGSPASRCEVPSDGSWAQVRHLGWLGRRPMSSTAALPRRRRSSTPCGLRHAGFSALRGRRVSRGDRSAATSECMQRRPLRIGGVGDLANHGRALLGGLVQASAGSSKHPLRRSMLRRRNPSERFAVFRCVGATRTSGGASPSVSGDRIRARRLC
jgi:hypothetical protein